MAFYMKAPCTHCPFRKDVKPFLHPSRGEELAYHATAPYTTFPCHKTTVPIEVGEDCEMGYDDKTKHCAGFLTLQAAECGEDFTPKGFTPAYDLIYSCADDMTEAYKKNKLNMRKQFLIRIYNPSMIVAVLANAIGHSNSMQENKDIHFNHFEDALAEFCSTTTGCQEVSSKYDNGQLIVKDGEKLLCVIEERVTHVLNHDVLPEEKAPEQVHIDAIPMGGFFEYAAKTFFKAKSTYTSSRKGYSCYEVGSGFILESLFHPTTNYPTMVTHIKQL